MDETEAPGAGEWLVWSPFPLAAEPDAVVPAPTARAAAARRGDRVLDGIATAIDTDYYRAIAGLAATDDPVRHYAERGVAARLNPNTWFDTGWYLDTYPDIARAGMNPLYHYVAFGKAEGRLPRRPGGPARLLVEQASIPAHRRPGYDAPTNAPRMDAIALGHHLAAACAGRAGLVVSVSHDCYVRVTGGMQVLIADEQALFNADRVSYLHLSPAIARLTFAPDTPDSPNAGLLQVVLDGRFLGLSSESELLAALHGADKRHPLHRLLVVHSVFGHRPAMLAELADALRPAHSFFWLHDYGALCEGFNLLRNDVAYCHAPPPDSAACRICVYGAGRATWLDRLGILFRAVPFHVLAPSRAALDLFLARSDLAFRSARVHENLTLTPGETLPHPGPSAPVRVAFAGYAMPQKGWPAFRALVERCAGSRAYRFHHFAIPAAHIPMAGVRNIAVEVTPDDRFAMARALRAAAIDLVLVLSPWPETFSFVVHEAFAAGADVVALADSGNVADAVRRHARGVVLADEAALLRFFEQGYAVSYVRRRAASGASTTGLDLGGTTATVDLDRADNSRPVFTHDPALSALLPAGAIAPVPDGNIWRFDLPPRTGKVRLFSRHVADTHGTPRGVEVAALTLDGTDVALNDPRLGLGWCDPTPDGRWTVGDAELDVAGASRLELRLALGGRYRVLPVVAA